jgi:hypothetical protein
MKAFWVVWSFLFISFSSIAGTISLIADTTLPDPNDEITVWVHTDEPLLFMSLDAYVRGDATITSAMSDADCNDFGWESGWGFEPFIDDPNGWVSIGGIKWAADANDIVGYFKIRYNSGYVTIYIDQENSVAGNWGSNFSFSDMAISFGEMVLPPLQEPNEPAPVLVQCPLGSGGPPRGEFDSFAGWSQELSRTLDELDSQPTVIEINSDITTNQVWDANNVYHITDVNGIDVQALLVIEPGTTVIFGYQCGLFVNNGGTLISKGTPDKPIIFTPDWLYYDYPDYIGYYWQVLESDGPYYYSPLYIEETASPGTTIRYNLIEGAVAGIVTDNISLVEPIENNYLFGNIWGIFEFGPKLTDIRNNLCFYNDQSGIEAYLAHDPNDVPDANNIFTIEQNTCDAYQYCGITIHGVQDPNEAPIVHLLNNIVSSSYWYGLNLVDGAMYASAINTGYYDNFYNKNWEFDEYNPVTAQADPYYSYIGETPYWHHHLVEGSDFIDVGSQYIEQTKLVGTTTNFDSLPDKDTVDLGFHHTDWGFVGGVGIAGTDIDDLIEISENWLQYSPFDPNSPGYIDPNLYIFDPNHPELWVDPNFVTYGSDWNDNGFVDLTDFSLMAQIWNAAPAVPDLQPVTTGNPNDGRIELSVSGCNADTQLVYAYINGKYIGQVYALGEAIPRVVDVSESGNLPQEIKFIAIDFDGHFAYTNTTEINYTSPLSYCIIPATYEPNEPIPFTAFNTGDGDAIVEVYGDGGQLVWSQNFIGNTISGFIPADYTGIQHTIDNIVFSSDSGGFVGKTTYPRVPLKGVDTKIQALLVMPDPTLFDYDPQCRYAIIRAFSDKGIPFARFEASEATWENVAKYGQHGFVKYLYFLGHGAYKYEYGDPNSPTIIYRTRQTFADCTVLPCKATEFETPPSWCVPFPENIERSVHTWASMQFDRLVWVYNDACYGGRLKINGADQLVEGQPGQQGLVFDGPQSDISLALYMQNTYEPRCYHGWYNPAWFGSLHQTSYQEWGKAVWNWLHDGHDIYEALNHAIDECEDFSADAAVNNYRLKGQGELTKVYLKHVYSN